MKMLAHNCPKYNDERIYVKAGEECIHCKFKPLCKCHCMFCNVTPHTQYFEMLFDPKDNDKYPEYKADDIHTIKKQVEMREKYEKKRRDEVLRQNQHFLTESNEVNAALEKILAEAGNIFINTCFYINLYIIYIYIYIYRWN
jgi:hypothetical protein